VQIRALVFARRRNALHQLHQLDTTPTSIWRHWFRPSAISSWPICWGEIAYSNVGEGSIALFTIRCQVAHNEAQIVQGAPHGSRAAPGSGALRIDAASKLLSRHNPINQQVASRLLDKLAATWWWPPDHFEAISRAIAPRRATT
jgi:hypothetical protein